MTRLKMYDPRPQPEPLMPESPAVDSPQLERRLGLLHVTALNMTNMIGMGPFITIPLLMSTINGGGPQCMLGWLVAILITIPDGMVWAELGASMPGSGASYVYLREGFGAEKWGKMMAFLFIWQFMLSGPLEMATAFIGFAQYLSFLWPGMTSVQSQVVMVTVGLGTIFLLYRHIDPPMDIYFDKVESRLVRIDWRADNHRSSDWKEHNGVKYPAKCVGYKKTTGKSWYFSEIIELERLKELPEGLKR